MLGLAAVGDDQAEAALRSGAAFLLANQDMNFGGWPSFVSAAGNGAEITEDDGEALRALMTVFNTQTGQGVSVTPAQLSSVTFSNVTRAGSTSVFNIDSARLPALPGGYKLLDNLTYQVSTTAVVNGNITVCFKVPWVADAATFGTVRVLQRSGGTLVDRTILSGASAPEFASRRLCALTTMLDPFAIATRDITPPTLSVSVSPATMWPPNGKMVTITATINVHDDTDASPAVQLVSIAGSTARPNGQDVANAQFGTDDRQFDLRAAVSAGGKQTIYVITYRATDAAGNSTDATAQVVVQAP